MPVGQVLVQSRTTNNQGIRHRKGTLPSNPLLPHKPITTRQQVPRFRLRAFPAVGAFPRQTCDLLISLRLIRIGCGFSISIAARCAIAHTKLECFQVLKLYYPLATGASLTANSSTRLAVNGHDSRPRWERWIKIGPTCGRVQIIRALLFGRMLY